MASYTKMKAAQLLKELKLRNLDLVKVLRDNDFTTWNRIKAGLHSKTPEFAAENKVRTLTLMLF